MLRAYKITIHNENVGATLMVAPNFREVI